MIPKKGIPLDKGWGVMTTPNETEEEAAKILDENSIAILEMLYTLKERVRESERILAAVVTHLGEKNVYELVKNKREEEEGF